MPYVGVAPSSGLFKKLDSITVVNGQAAYTMQYNSSNFKPGTASQLIVSVNGVIQAPEDTFTIDGSTITFTENLVTGDVIDFIVALGEVGNTVTPVDGSVTASKLASSIDMQNITLKGGTTNALTIDSTGHVEMPNTKKFAFRAYRSSNQTGIAHNTTTVVQWDSEDYDVDSVFDTSTNRYTPTKPGYYLINVNLTVTSISALGDNVYYLSTIRKNGNSEAFTQMTWNGIGSGGANTINHSALVYLDGDDYIDTTFYHYNYTDTSTTARVDSGRTQSFVTGILIQEA